MESRRGDDGLIHLCFYGRREGWTGWHILCNPPRYESLGYTKEPVNCLACVATPEPKDMSLQCSVSRDDE
jgi:hypothetical protein